MAIRTFSRSDSATCLIADALVTAVELGPALDIQLVVIAERVVNGSFVSDLDPFGIAPEPATSPPKDSLDHNREPNNRHNKNRPHDRTVTLLRRGVVMKVFF